MAYLTLILANLVFFVVHNILMANCVSFGTGTIKIAHFTLTNHVETMSVVIVDRVSRVCLEKPELPR